MQTNITDPKNKELDLNDDARSIPIEIEGRQYYVWHALFENHAEGKRADRVWVELREPKTAPAPGEMPDLRSPQRIQLQRWPATLLYQLLRAAAKEG